jgi:hypothetical protein
MKLTDLEIEYSPAAARAAAERAARRAQAAADETIRRTAPLAEETLTQAAEGLARQLGGKVHRRKKVRP